jgi:hypothetical protein
MIRNRAKKFITNIFAAFWTIAKEIYCVSSKLSGANSITDIPNAYNWCHWINKFPNPHKIDSLMLPDKNRHVCGTIINIELKHMFKSAFNRDTEKFVHTQQIMNIITHNVILAVYFITKGITTHAITTEDIHDVYICIGKPKSQKYPIPTKSMINPPKFHERKRVKFAR